MAQLQSGLGVVVLLGFAYLISENRRAVDWRGVGVALLVTLATAVLPDGRDRGRVELKFFLPSPGERSECGEG